MLSQHAWVFSPMLPSTRFPETSAGIWPETKIWPLARMAWDYTGQGVSWFVDLDVNGIEGKKSVVSVGLIEGVIQ